MLVHQQRVVQEKKELDAKLEKLAAFNSGEVFKTLDGDEQDRLVHQAYVMTQYSEILRRRIQAFK